MTSFKHLPDNLKGALILMIAAFGFTMMMALIKLVGQRVSVVQILFVRQWVMVLILLPNLIRHFPDGFRTERLPLHFLRMTLALGAMLMGFTAVVNLPLADASALSFAKSFFVTIFAVIFLGEVVGVHRWAAVMVGFVGVLVMLQPGTEGFTIHGLMAVMGAGCAGAVMVLIRKLSKTDSTTTILLYQSLGVGIIMVIPALVFWVWPTPGEWALLVGIGVISYYAQKANILAFTFGEASMLASLDYVRLLYATVFGWWLFNTLPGVHTGIGAGVIVLASIYTVHRESRRQQTLAREPDARGFNST